MLDIKSSLVQFGEEDCTNMALVYRFLEQMCEYGVLRIVNRSPTVNLTERYLKNIHLSVMLSCFYSEKYLLSFQKTCPAV